MIKINLLPVKKKKAKPIPGFVILAIVVTVVVAAVLIYTVFYFNSKIESKKAEIAKNEKIIQELKEKIKEVEAYEKRNALFQQRKKIIEDLSRNKTVPVKIIDEVSNVLPTGVWLNGLTVKGKSVALNCTGFSNTDVVNYVTNLKNSKMFTDVYLKQSVQSKARKGAAVTLYNFTVTFKVKA